MAPSVSQNSSTLWVLRRITNNRQLLLLLLSLLLLLLFYEKRLHAVYKLQKDVCHNLWRAQTALIHYTRGPAE